MTVVRGGRQREICSLARSFHVLTQPAKGKRKGEKGKKKTKNNQWDETNPEKQALRPMRRDLHRGKALALPLLFALHPSFVPCGPKGKRYISAAGKIDQCGEASAESQKQGLPLALALSSPPPNTGMMIREKEKKRKKKEILRSIWCGEHLSPQMRLFSFMLKV